MTSPFHKITIAMQHVAWCWLSGVIAATTTLIGLELGVFQSFQSLTYNILFQLRGSTDWDERIAVVEIDDQSIEEIGQFPISRKYYAQFLEQLVEAQPSVVAFDIVFAEASDDDEALANAMNRLNRVVLAQSWDKRGKAVLPTPQLADNAIHMGHVLNRPSEDGISRTIQPYIQSIPSFGIAIAQSYSLIEEPIKIPVNQPTNKQLFWVNWPGTSGGCQSYSFHDVLAGRVAVDAFRNKIVILGVTASGDSPLRTPFDRNPPTGGVYLHAAVVNNLLQQNPLYIPGMGWHLLILVVGGPVLGMLSSYRGCRYRWSSWFGFCIGWNVLGLLLLNVNILIPAFWPIVLVTLTVGLTELNERLRANAYLQAEIKRLWSSYHADLILWQRPSTNLDTHSSHQPPSLSKSMAPVTTSPIAVQRAMQLAQLADLFGRSQSLHAAIAHSLSIGLIAADWNGTVWLCNPVAATLINLRIGESLEDKLIPDWVTLEHWNQNLLQMSQLESPCWELQRDETWFEIKLEPLFYTHQTDEAVQGQSAHVDSISSDQASILQKPTGFLVLIEDITTFKQVEQTIRNALAEALEFSELKTRFVSMASHELRTPLTVMRTSIELLQSLGLNIPPEKHRDYLERMRASVTTMKTLIEDVLVLGKAETRRLKFHPKPLSLEPFCRDLIEDVQFGALSAGRIHLTVHTDQHHVLLDPDLLALILNNLLSNALKYSPTESCVYVNVYSSEEQIIFEVTDHGIGIPDDYQKHLFEEFNRAPNVGNIPGSGLGLSIVKRCVELHGGTISVESCVGSGTTFRISLNAGLSSSN